MEEIIKKIKDNLKEIFNKYPLAIISGILLSIVLCIGVNVESNIIDTFETFLVTFSITSFLIETMYKRNSIKYYLLPSLAGIFFTVISNIKNVTDSDIYVRLLVFYFASVILYGLYLNYKNTKKSLSKYLISCFSNLFKAGIILSVLNIGFVLILVLFDTLISNGSIDWTIYLEFILLGCYLYPASIYSVYNYEEPGVFIKTIVTKIFFSLVLIAYLVVYIYIFKILITTTLPSNTIFPLLLALFCIGTITNIMGKDSENNKVLCKLHKLLPYLYCPFIILECYSLGVRIFNFGLTISRYLGIIAIIFEIIYTIVLIKKKDEGVLIIVLIVMIFISTIVPNINCYDLSISDQFSYIEKYKENGKINKKVKGAYEYLIDTKKGKELIKDTLNDSEINEIKNYKKYEVDEEETYYYSEDVKEIDVNDYSKIEILSKSYTDPKKDFFLKKIDSCRSGNSDDCFENNNIIDKDNNRYVIKYVYCNYKEDNSISYCTIEYYKLSK